MKRKIIFILLFIFQFQLDLFGQSVVISEYYNSNLVRNEWTELLVIEDNINLTGWTLRDNSGSTGTPDSWRGGVRFRNHPLWRNIRKGTIIVINHRRNLIYNNDFDKSDGYIEVDAENTEYFEKRCFDCDTASDWIYRALSIAQTSDIIQLLDNQERHIHALAHIPVAPKGDYIGINGPKACLNGSMQNNSSLRIVPGLSLPAYNSGYGNTELEESTINITKGKPNYSVNYQNENQLFWRKLRQPEWSSPNLFVQIFSNQNYIEWNPMIDPYSDDNLSGYLIARAPLEALNSFQNPEDGKIYSVGDSLGSAVVIGVIENSNIINFYDNFSQRCGTGYIYKVYAFRFRKDYLGEDTNPFFSRGRNYNETDFAQGLSIKNFPDKIKFKINKWEICKGDSINLNISIPYNYKELLWFRNDIIIDNSGKSDIIIKDDGDYFCKIINEFGCEVYSDTFQLITKPLPNNSIFVNGNLLLKDTVIFKCKSEQLSLTVMEENEIEWYHNGNLVTTNISSLNANEQGTYFATLRNKDGCSIKTYNVEIINLSDYFEIIPKEIEFTFLPGENYQDKIISIKNLSKNILNIISITASPEILITPDPPLQIASEEVKELTLRLQPKQRSESTSKVIFSSLCGFDDTLLIKVKFKDSTLYLSKSLVDCGTLIACYKQSLKGVFQIYNSTNIDAIIYEPFVEAPFGYHSLVFPFVLKANSRVDMGFNFYPQTVGKFRSKMIIPYNINNKLDTLFVDLVGENLLPEVEISPDYFELPLMLDCDSSSEAVISITNHSRFEVYPKLKYLDSHITISNLPDKLLPNESKELIVKVNAKYEIDTLLPIDFIINPCEITYRVNLKAKKKNISINFEQDTIDFGRVVFCGDPIYLNKIMKLTINNSDSSRKFSLKFINTNGNYKSNLYYGKEISEDEEIIVVFNPVVDGNFTGYMKFLLEPCNIEKYIYLKGQRVSPQLQISEKLLDFGKVQINSISYRKLKLSNNGEVEIEIDKINKPEKPFSFNNFNINFPITIQPNSELTIEFAYSTTFMGLFTNQIELEIIEPCQWIETVALSGESFIGDTLRFRMFVPHLKAKAGDDISIPIYINIANQSGIQSLSVNNIKFDICYNPTMFKPRKVSIGNAIDTVQVESIELKEDIIGRSSIDIYLKDELKITDGVLVYLSGKALSGDSIKTKLKPERIHFSSNRLFDYSIEEGELEIEGNCNPEKRLIDLTKKTVFEIIEISGNNISFLVDIISNDQTKFAIFNNLGCELVKFSEDIGKYSIINIDIQNFSSGIYYAVLINGNIIKQLSFLVIK